MRNISFALTTAQVRAQTKTVTRRLGWTNLKVGERLQACEKCMGRRHGEPLVKLCVIEVVSVRRERLDTLTCLPLTDGCVECKREGFPDMLPFQFVEFFCHSHKGCTPETIVTRIEFKYV